MADETTAPEGDTEQASVATAKTQTPQVEATTAAATSTEQQAAATQPAEVKATVDNGLLGEADNKEVSAPDSYEDFSLGEGIEITPEDQAVLKEMAKEHNLTQGDAQKAVQFSRSIVQQLAKESEVQYDKFKADNKKVWESQPDYEQKTLLANTAVKKLGPEVQAYLSESGHIHDARIMGILAELGKFYNEPTIVAGTDTAPHGAGRAYDKSPELYS